MFVGWFMERQGILALWIYSIGYALGNFQYVLQVRKQRAPINVPASIFCQCGIIIVYQPSLWVEDNVF